MKRLPFPYRGGAASLLLAVLLLIPPAAVLDREGAFADSRADLFTTRALPVRLKDTLRTDLSTIPPTPGNWTSQEDRSWPAILGTYLRYDALLVRDYVTQGLYQPVQLMVLTARHATAFHNPELCFTVQGGDVHVLPPTSLAVPGVASAANVTVGRLLVTYANLTQPVLVYNVYVVERHLLAADRTTWVRLAFFGADPDHLEDADAMLTELAGRLLPTMFSTSGQARTTLGWVAANFGATAATASVLAALAPAVAEVVLLRRKEAP